MDGNLFGPDQPPQLDSAWMMKRVNRCERQMWAIARYAADLGTPVIVDCGLTRVEHRFKWAELARLAQLPIRLHFLDVQADDRWRRLQRRDRVRGATYRLEVTREMFDFIEAIWEPPSVAEIRAIESSGT